MPAANASPRGQRILASPLAELTGFLLTVDCRGPDCGGERCYAITALAACYAPAMTVGEVLRQMRCARGCGARPGGRVVGDRPGSQSEGASAEGGVAAAGGEEMTASTPSD